MINDLLEDKDNRRICMSLSAKADTAAGEYVNEYMWLLDFDESGTKIRRSKEYSDTVRIPYHEVCTQTLIDSGSDNGARFLPKAEGCNG